MNHEIENPAQHQLPAATTDCHRLSLLCTRTLKACTMFYPCKCHKERRLRTPSVMSEVLGAFTLKYKSSPLTFASCDSDNCQKSNTFRIAVAYTFPSWFLNLIISMEMRDLAPEPVFRILRRRPKDCSIFEALRQQEIETIRTMMIEGEASIRDVSEDGRSLLQVCHQPWSPLRFHSIDIVSIAYSGLHGPR